MCLALAMCLAFGVAAGVQAGPPQPAAPLSLTHRFDLPESIQGHFDHFAVDPAGKRLFGTAVEHKSVVVFDFEHGKLLAEIRGIDEPRAVLYRPDVGRLFVSDGGGALHVFDSKTFAPLSTLRIAVDADPIAYDPATRRLFVVNGGEKAKHSYSNITVFDTDTSRQVGDIQVEGVEIEGMTVESGGPRLFVNNRDKNEIDIVDRQTLSKLAVWPLTRIKRNTVAALDESTHRLFVAGHNGQLLVADSANGAELQVLPIGMGADDIALDPRTRRIYVAAGGANGSIDVYEEVDADHYRSVGKVTTAPGAATARLIPELDQYIVMAPAQPHAPAQVLVFDVAAAR
jgi:DNA-binding beta-propeller fold protein YncE